MKEYLIHYKGVNRNRETESYFFLERGSIGAVTRFLNESHPDDLKGLTFNVYDVTLIRTKDIMNILDTLAIVKTYHF